MDTSVIFQSEPIKQVIKGSSNYSDTAKISALDVAIRCRILVIKLSFEQND